MEDYILKVDINCTNCGRLMALSNAFVQDNKYLCPKCAPILEEIFNTIEKRNEK